MLTIIYPFVTDEQLTMPPGVCDISTHFYFSNVQKCFKNIEEPKVEIFTDSISTNSM